MIRDVNLSEVVMYFCVTYFLVTLSYSVSSDT